MARCFIICAVLLASGVCSAKAQSSPPTEGATESSAEEPPEGYYAFVESPNATPPRVRPPPYNQIPSECPDAGETRPHVSAANLCGDLNRGLIPRNPMGHNPGGEPYPFELIRNHTLRFLSRTLPVLRADDTLPRVAHYATPQQPQQPQQQYDDNRLDERIKRSADMADMKDAVESKASWLEAEHRTEESPRESRKFCDGGGVFCMLYRAINGESTPTAGVERREDPGHPSHPGLPSGHSHPHPAPRYEGPPTPCPARVEYATPVFARNYQGVWRYVVQIPYEGYFTQTVEVTRCMQSRCHYLDGGCLSSPRWVSLLVAEMHYPAASSSPSAPSTSHQAQHSPATPQLNDFQEYHQYLQKRAGLSGGGAAGAGQEGGGQPSPSPSHNPPPAAHCDGHDELGCYQVRLYYDWFLVPGSCKCWRPDYFARYVRRRNNNEL